VAQAFFYPPFQRPLRFCETPAFRERAESYGGYDLDAFGTVHFNGP